MPAKNQVRTPEGWSNPCIAPVLSNEPTRIRLSHVIAPTCWWSWGYEATLHRIRLVYGNQVELNLALSPVYHDRDHWMKHNQLTPRRWAEWARESARRMGIPIFTGYDRRPQPMDVTPPVFAVLAAARQAPDRGERVLRALLRRACVEGEDVTTREALLAAAGEAGIDMKRFEKDLADRAGLQKDLDVQHARLPEISLGFYNLVVEDGQGRKIILDHAYDPVQVEAAIDFLSDGRLRKNRPTSLAQYIEAAGPTGMEELSRVFSESPAALEAELQAHEKAGRLARATLGSEVFWTLRTAASRPLQSR